MSLPSAKRRSSAVWRSKGSTNATRSVLPGESTGNQMQDFRRDIAFGYIDEVGDQAVRNGLIESRFIDEAAIHHCLCNRLSVQLCFVQDVLSLRRLKYALLDKKFGKLFVRHIFVEALKG